MKQYANQKKQVLHKIRPAGKVVLSNVFPLADFSQDFIASFQVSTAMSKSRLLNIHSVV